MALAGRESEPVRLSVRDHHACSVFDRSRVQNGVGPSGLFLHSSENFESHDHALCDSILVMLSAFPR